MKSNKRAYLLLIFILWGCGNTNPKCERNNISKNSINFIRQINPLKITFDLRSDFNELLPEIFEAEAYKLIKNYEYKDCKITIFIISEHPLNDSDLRGELISRSKYYFQAPINIELFFEECNGMKGYWMESSNKPTQYKLFEGGNFKENLRIRIILTQKNGKISNYCFEEILKSIRFTKIEMPAK